MSNYHFNIAFKQKCKAQSRAFLKLDNTRSSLTRQPSCGIESILVNRICEGKSNQTKSIDQLFAQRNLQGDQNRQRASFYYEDNSEIESVQAFFYFYKLLQAEKNNLSRQEFNSLLRKKNDKIVEIIQESHANKARHTNGNTQKDKGEEDENSKNNISNSKQLCQQLELQPSMSNSVSQINSHVLISSNLQQDILQSCTQSPKGSIVNSKTPSIFHSPAVSRGQTPKQAEKQQSICYSSKQSDSSPRATNIDSQINFSNKSSLFFTPKNTIKIHQPQRQSSSFNSITSQKFLKSPTSTTSKISQETDNQLLNTRESYFNTDNNGKFNNYFTRQSGRSGQKYNNNNRLFGIGSTRLFSGNSVSSNGLQESSNSLQFKHSSSQKQLINIRNNNNKTTPNIIQNETTNNNDNPIEFENMKIQHLMNTFGNNTPNHEKESSQLLQNSEEIKTSSLCISQEQNQQSVQLSPIHLHKLLPLQQSFTSEYEIAVPVLDSNQKTPNIQQQYPSEPTSILPNSSPPASSGSVHHSNFFSERNSAKSIFMKTIWQQIDLQSGIHSDEIKEEKEATESSARTAGANTPKFNLNYQNQHQDNSPLGQQQGSLKDITRPKPMHVLKPSFSLQVDSSSEDQPLPKPTPSIYKPQNSNMKQSEKIPIQRGKSALNIGKSALNIGKSQLNPLATMKSSDQFLDSHDILSGSKGKGFSKTKKSIFMDIIFKNALSLDNVLTNKIDQSLIHRKNQLHNSNTMQIPDIPVDHSSSENNSNTKINNIPQPKPQIFRSSSIAEQFTPPLAPTQLKFASSFNQDQPSPAKQPYLVVQQLNKQNLIKKEDGDGEQAIINLRNDISKNMTKIDSLLQKKATYFVNDDTQKPKPISLNASISMTPSGRRCLTRAEVGKMYSVSKYFDIQKQVSMDYSQAKKNVFFNNQSPHHRIITKNTSFVDNFH